MVQIFIGRRLSVMMMIFVLVAYVTVEVFYVALRVDMNVESPIKPKFSTSARIGPEENLLSSVSKGQVADNHNYNHNEGNNNGGNNGYGDAKKYIQYFSQAGWANQLICLKGAYEIALVTGRTLVLSPILPHFHSYMADVLDVDKQKFDLNYSLEESYLVDLPENKYILLGHVLDLNASLPGLASTVDFREFHRDFRTDTNNEMAVTTLPATWALETTVSHFNTQWIRNQSSLEGTQTEIVVTEHQVDLRYNRTFRDVVKFSQMPPFRDYPLWTLLDSFRVKLHESVYRNGKSSSFRPRFQTNILRASRAIQKERWKGIPYASVHIRGSDGHFKSNMDMAITMSLQMVAPFIHEWIGSNALFLNHSAAGTNTTKTASTRPKSVGLFVATDIQNIHQKSAFLEKTAALRKGLKDAHGIELKLLFSDNQNKKNANAKNAKKKYKKSEKSSASPLEPEVEVLFDRNPRNWVGYPRIFLDQQLAACASIAFAGTKGSSFSNFINTLRKDNLAEICDNDYFGRPSLLRRRQ